MRPRWIALFAVFVLGGIVAFAGYAWQPEIAAVDGRNNLPSDEAQVIKGAQLALIGNCNSCHTQESGAPYAGGRAIATPFGTLYATNITPDPETGIGRWSEQAFLRSMREGVRRDGAHLYPAFPYDHFTKMSAEDIRAIYAFLMTREPVRAEAPPNELPFPFNIRMLIAGWKLLFLERGEFRPDETQTAEWNRGAYLAEGLAHCGACHTPRNILGAEKRDQSLSGGESEYWHAPALNAASPAPVPWTQDQLFTYLRRGFVEPHGVAAGPMQPVVNNLHDVPEQEVAAIATYIGSVLVPATADRQRQPEPPVTPSVRAHPTEVTGSGGEETSSEAAVIYAGACALCHEPTGQRFSAHGIQLSDSKLLTMPDPRNLIHVILDGIESPKGAPHAWMPGFEGALTDEQVQALVGYLRDNFTDEPAWNDVDERIREVRGSQGD